MSLVENLARRKHRATDLLQGIEILQKQGYDDKTISTKTGLSFDYIQGILHLMAKGEERMLSAVEAGLMPLTLAIRISENPEDEQRALRYVKISEKCRLQSSKLHKRQMLIIELLKTGMMQKTPRLPGIYCY